MRINKKIVGQAYWDQIFDKMLKNKKIHKFPDSAGYFYWFETKDSEHQLVLVEEGVNGRFCRELKMGGSVHYGYSGWNGYFLPINL